MLNKYITFIISKKVLDQEMGNLASHPSLPQLTEKLVALQSMQKGTTGQVTYKVFFHFAVSIFFFFLVKSTLWGHHGTCKELQFRESVCRGSCGVASLGKLVYWEMENAFLKFLLTYFLNVNKRWMLLWMRNNEITDLFISRKF